MKLKYCTFFLLLPIIVFGQDQNPPSLKWEQIKTPHFKIIFPTNIHNKGIETAVNLEKTYFPASKSLDTEVKEIPVVIFNQTTISNGYTALAPRHMGFYTTPHQDALAIGGTDWMQLLSIHEFRHATQFQKVDKNFNSFFSVLLGDFGRSFCVATSIPMWVLEGDAVCTETVYTSEGRGRLPSFMRDIAALESEDIRYSYYKAYLGSYRDYYPDFYHLGYLMTSYVRRHYGDEVWSKIVDRTTWASFYPFIFSNSLKYYTGQSIRQTYRDCMNEFDSLIAEAKVMPNTNFTSNTPDRKIYSTYEYPGFIGNDSIITLKRGLADRPSLVILNNNVAKKLIEINPIDRIHSNGKLVVWSSLTADLRWGERNFADIMMYDIRTKILSTLTEKGKYFAPAVSPDGSMIAAIEYADDMVCKLTILSTHNGEKLSSYTFGKNEFARMPQWSDENDKVVLTVFEGQERNICIYNLADKKLNLLMPKRTESLSYPVFYSDYILFNTVYKEKDVIQAININTLERYLVATSKYGVYNASVSNDNNTLAFQNYTIKGNDIVLQEIDIRQWEKLPADDKNEFLISQEVKELEDGYILFEKNDTTGIEGLEVKPYRPILHAINIHSWIPTAVSNGIELSVYSDDLLKTTSFRAGFDYFPDDAAFREFLELKYSKFFPILDIGFSYGQKYNRADSADVIQFEKLFEKVLTAGISIPLNFSRHIYNTNATLGLNYNYIYQNYPESGPTHAAGSSAISVMEFNFSIIRARKKAFRDLYPRFSQEINLITWNTPFDNEKIESRYILDGKLIFPGLAKHHSVILSGGTEINTNMFRKGVYSLTNELEYIRGYDRDTLDNISRGTIEYSLPLVYPDLAVGGLFYLKRISTNLFYDHGFINDENNNFIINSVGFDLNFDFNLFSNFLSIQTGIRYSYRLQDQEHRVEFLLLGVAL